MPLISAYDIVFFSPSGMEHISCKVNPLTLGVIDK